MAWVTWRQHRVALAGAVLFLGVIAVAVWTAGLHLHHAYAAARSCRPGSITCQQLVGNLLDMNHALVGGWVLLPMPALIGAFVGAPVLARELETGTFRFAWTQGIGRTRWAVSKLVSLGVVLAVVTGAISALFSWYYQPYFASDPNPSTQLSPLAAGIFPVRGIAFAGWTLAAFAIGVFVGMLIRRVVPAIVTTLVAYTGLSVIAGMYLRPHYQAPVVSSTQNVSGTAWVISRWGTHDGRVAFTGFAPDDLVRRYCTPASVGPGKPAPGSLAQCLSQHGYRLLTSYQPASRFWTFQWIETSWLVVLSAALIAATVWLVRRRAS
jgi:hypothetical protein